MVTPQAADQINALRITVEQIPGIAMTPEYNRVYPDGPLADRPARVHHHG